MASQPIAVPRATLALVFWLLAGLASSAAGQPVFPELTGRIVDGAGLLDGQEREHLRIDLQALEAKSTDQLVVVTLPSLQGYEIEDFGYRLGRHWGIGQAGKDNGVLLIVAPKERKVRIEVGRGLEGVLTDALSKIIIENAILPEFRGGDFPAGIVAGVRDITSVLLGDAEEVKARAVTDTSESHDDIITLIVFMIWLTIFVLVMWNIIESARSDGTKGKGRGGWASGSGRSRRSGGGGWSGGSGGGFSGGGGGFGGGGSSGSW